MNKLLNDIRNKIKQAEKDENDAKRLQKMLLRNLRTELNRERFVRIKILSEHIDYIKSTACKRGLYFRGYRIDGLYDKINKIDIYVADSIYEYCLTIDKDSENLVILDYSSNDGVCTKQIESFKEWLSASLEYWADEGNENDQER